MDANVMHLWLTLYLTIFFVTSIGNSSSTFDVNVTTIALKERQCWKFRRLLTKTRCDVNFKTTSKTVLGPNQIYFSNARDFELKKCFCDSDCIRYGDCCKDRAHHLMVLDNEQHRWTCERLYKVSISDSHIVNAYMISTCKHRWSNDFLKDKCEKSGNSGSYIEHIPAFGLSTKLMYKNVYCAYCNGELDIHRWKIRLQCLSHSSASSKDLKEYLIDDNYKDRKWTFIKNGSFWECKIVIDELREKNSFTKYGLRVCQKAKDSCLDEWKNTEVEKLCQQYASYEWFHQMKFKNLFCVACNNIPLGNTLCSHISFKQRIKITSSYDSPAIGGKSNDDFGMLFDIDLADGNTVGNHGGDCKSNEIFDPLNQKCVILACGKLFKLVDGECLLYHNGSLMNNTIQIGCPTITLTEDKYQIISDGTLFVKEARKQSYVQGEFELLQDSIHNSLVKVCVDDYEQQSKYLWYLGLVSKICLYVSIACLTVHIWVYIVVPRLRNLPGKNLLSLSVSLLIAQVSFLIDVSRSGTYELCYAKSLSMHYFFLAYFFWMSVMALDIFSTFRSTVGKDPGKRYGFVKNSCFAWLTPLLIVVAALVADNTSILEESFRPGYAVDVCWISQRKGLLIFFTVPVAAILLVNIILFLMTAHQLWMVSKITKRVVKRPDRVRYLLYVKLALIMGLTWTTAFVAAFIKSPVLNLIYIVMNGLQGAMIFLAFTFKKKTYKEICKTFNERTTFFTSFRLTMNKSLKSSTKTTNVNSGSVAKQPIEMSTKSGI